MLSGNELLLRRSCATMLKQLAQRQPAKLLQHSTKLDELLFKMLDIEVRYVL